MTTLIPLCIPRLFDRPYWRAIAHDKYTKVLFFYDHIGGKASRHALLNSEFPRSNSIVPSSSAPMRIHLNGQIGDLEALIIEKEEVKQVRHKFFMMDRLSHRTSFWAAMSETQSRGASKSCGSRLFRRMGLGSELFIELIQHTAWSVGPDGRDSRYHLELA